MKEKQKQSKEYKIREWNNISFGCMLLVIFFSVTLFLVECLNKFRGTNTKMYLIILFVSIIWIFSFGINIITICMEKNERRKTTKTKK